LTIAETAERWRQVKRLFHDACERAPEERVAFLDVACDGDVELRREIESLLAVYERAGDFMEQPALNLPPADAETEIEAGRRINHYRVERRIGSGGMGEVYLAHDTRLGRRVALKLLRADLTRDDERVRRFEQEARAASALNHPNILTFYEIGRVAETHSIARPSRRHRASRHQAGKHHGAARRLREGARLRPGQAQPRVFRPTPDRIRPQRRRDAPGHSAGHGQLHVAGAGARRASGCAHDIFALGVMLYEMVAGRRPFAGPTDSHVLVAIQDQEPPPLAPAELNRVVGRMLAKDCAGRFQTAEEARLALKGLKRELTAPGDFSTRGFSRLARRFGYAGASVDTIKDTTVAPARTTSTISLHIGRLVRSPLRGAVALVTIALAITGAILGWRWLASRDAPVNSDEALIHLRKMLEIDSNNGAAHFFLGRVFSQQGKHQEAISELRRAFGLNRSHSGRAWLAHGYARAGRRNEALKLLRELEALSTRERVSPAYIARIYSGLGAREPALTWLRKAYDEHSDHVTNIGVDPAYDPLRSDPRFIEMLRGIGLAP
jgi:tetratricopeptide (TPR) repeat protein